MLKRIPILMSIFLVAGIWSFATRAATWARTYGTTQDEVLYAVVPNSDGGVLMVGYAMKAGTTDSSGLAIRTDASGAIVWQKLFGGFKGLRFDAAMAAEDGGFVLAGHTDSFGAGKNDFLLTKIDGAGELLWMHTYGGAKDDIATCLSASGDGGVPDRRVHG